MSHLKITYRADATNDENSDKDFYFPLEDTTFKERCRNHTSDLKHERY